MTNITTADTDYGSAANGLQVGSGFDVEIKRSGPTTALVCVTRLRSKDEWMKELEIEDGTDLQALAVEIGNCPELGNEGWIPDESSDEDITDAWDELVDKWDAIKVEK